MLNVLLVLASVIVLLLVARSLVWQLLFKSSESDLDGFLSKGRLWLEENGYDVLNVSPKAAYTSYVDNSLIRYEESAQMIARKNGYEYAVFVGSSQPSDEDIHQRLFPLYLILGVHGLVFLNLADERIHHVDFTISRSNRYHMRQWFRRGCWFFCGVLFAFAWVHRM